MAVGSIIMAIAYRGSVRGGCSVRSMAAGKVSLKGRVMFIVPSPRIVVSLNNGCRISGIAVRNRKIEEVDSLSGRGVDHESEAIFRGVAQIYGGLGGGLWLDEGSFVVSKCIFFRMSGVNGPVCKSGVGRLLGYRGRRVLFVLSTRCRTGFSMRLVSRGIVVVPRSMLGGVSVTVRGGRSERACVSVSPMGRFRR